MKNKKINDNLSPISIPIILNIILAVCFFILGYASSELKNNFPISYHQEGCFYKNTTKPEFNYGDWVCVNVEGMSYERGLKVCEHEMGHEIFAEYCENENNIEKCINLTKKN